MGLADDILSAVEGVTKEWTKQRKAEEKGNRSRTSRVYYYSDRVNFTDVVGEILPPAHAHASGDGRYTVSKRQLYYACREAFLHKTDRELEFPYFAGTLLVQYLNRHPDLGWKITADPRGTLSIPNTGHALDIPVGTIEIDNHLHRAGVACDPYDDAESQEIDVEWPSVAAGQRYQAVLYIEKEGFGPILEEARIAERFDLAIMSCKGQSVVAARRFVDEVCAAGRGVPLLTVTDFDKAGFEIAQCLTRVSRWARENDRVTYRFRNAINVIHLGLRLADARAYDLQSEPCDFKGHFARDSIATAEEQAFLRSGRRIELNAFTSPQFIEWLEAKLREHGLGKRLIPTDKVLEDAYRRALAIAAINRAIDDVRDEAIDRAKAANIPKTLPRKLARKLKEEDSPAWDKVLYQFAAEEESKLSQDDED
jgi:hypothetical protein